jgi:hypothetical protein
MLIHFTIVYSRRSDAMKVYVHEKGVILVGKAWEIKQKLLEYRKQFETVQAWVNSSEYKNNK